MFRVHSILLSQLKGKQSGQLARRVFNYLNSGSGIISYNPDYQLGRRETALYLVQFNFIVECHYINTNFSCKPVQ